MTTTCYYLVYALSTVCYTPQPVPQLQPIPPAIVYQGGSVPQPNFYAPQQNSFIAHLPTLPGLNNGDDQ